MTKRKVTLYFDAETLAETQRESVRQDRSLSWIIQATWRIAKAEMRKLPSAEPHAAEERRGPHRSPLAPPAGTIKRVG